MGPYFEMKGKLAWLVISQELSVLTRQKAAQILVDRRVFHIFLPHWCEGGGTWYDTHLGFFQNHMVPLAIPLGIPVITSIKF